MHTERPVIVEMKNQPVVGAASRWASAQWVLSGVRSAAVADDGGVTADGQSETIASDALDHGADNADGSTLAFAGLNVRLHPSEGEGYWLNLNSPAPCLFVMWRQETGELPTPWVVSASYNEAGRMLDAGEKVEQVPMPEGFFEWISAFTTTHYKPEPRKKVKRNDPFAQGAFRRANTQTERQ